MLYTLIYVSKAIIPLNGDELRDLLNKSKQWNDYHNLTGMLLYIDGTFGNQIGGRFIQVLEGDMADVKYIFDKIKVDPRHQNLTLMNESPIEKRNFKTWSMGFNAVKLEDFVKTEGYFDLDDLESIKSNPKAFNIPVMYLRSFYQLQTGKM